MTQKVSWIFGVKRVGKITATKILKEGHFYEDNNYIIVEKKDLITKKDKYEGKYNNEGNFHGTGQLTFKDYEYFNGDWNDCAKTLYSSVIFEEGFNTSLINWFIFPLLSFDDKIVILSTKFLSSLTLPGQL